MSKESNWRAVQSCDGLYLVEDEKGGHVTDYVTSKSKADLLAASPELLAALCEARDMLRDLPDDDGNDYLMQLVDRCDAAISKAEGRNP